MENKTNLIKLYFLKEYVHWYRMKIGILRFKTITGKIIGGGLITLLISIFHYIFAIPHFIFECFMWCLNNEQYKINMKNLTIKANEQISLLKEESKIIINKN